MEDAQENVISEGDDLQIKIPDGSFDGPFQLLWQMIKEHDLDILNLPLSFVADTYLKYLHEMRKVDINLASEFLVMAAELLRMKSQLLLPVEEQQEQDGENDEMPDPREELVRRLLIYQKFKGVSERIAALPLLGQTTFTRSVAAISSDIDIGLEAPLQATDAFALVKILYKVVEGKKEKIPLEFFTERINIADKISDLVDYFCEHETAGFHELISKIDIRQEIITTFLAMLEMVKLKMIRIHQTETGGEIYLSLVSREMLLNPVYKENGFDYR